MKKIKKKIKTIQLKEVLKMHWVLQYTEKVADSEIVVKSPQTYRCKD